MKSHGNARTSGLEVTTLSREETLALAGALGKLLQAGDVVALVGELGSGKTTFTKGLCLGLGMADAGRVSSPTYVLEHVYPTRIPFHHYDVYRLTSVEDLVAIGFEERLEQPCIVAVEWADKAASVLPPGHLRVELSWPERQEGGETRRIALSGRTENWSARLDLLGGWRQALKFPPPNPDR